MGRFILIILGLDNEVRKIYFLFQAMMLQHDIKSGNAGSELNKKNFQR